MEPIWPPHEPCPCGSGLQYVKCHYGRVYRNHAELEHDIPKFMHSQYRCIAPVSSGFCGQIAIKSHTLPKSASLKKIAVGSHVYGFSNGPNTKPQGHVEKHFQKVSIAKASTFPGFCAEHDHSIFLSADGEMQGTDFKSSLLHSYRAVCYETAIHSRGALFNVFVAKNARFEYPFSSGFASAETALMLKWAKHGWLRKKSYESRLQRSSSRKYWFAAGQTKEVLPFASIGCFPIEVDFKGRRLQDNVSDERFAFCELWVIPTKWGTTFGVGALEGQNPKALQAFIRSFANLNRMDMVSKMLQLTVVHIENTYFNIPFIDGLPQIKVSGLLDLFDECLVNQLGDRQPLDALSRSPIVKLPQTVESFFSNAV